MNTNNNNNNNNKVWTENWRGTVRIALLTVPTAP